MALSDAQLESRLKNIESTIEQRFASNELKINEFVEKLSSMLRMIENNDTSVKAEVKDKFEVQEKRMAKMSAELTRVELQSSSSDECKCQEPRRQRAQ